MGWLPFLVVPRPVTIDRPVVGGTRRSLANWPAAAA
jgi:hypothetical protein